MAKLHKILTVKKKHLIFKVCTVCSIRVGKNCTILILMMMPLKCLCLEISMTKEKGQWFFYRKIKNKKSRGPKQNCLIATYQREQIFYVTIWFIIFRELKLWIFELEIVIFFFWYKAPQIPKVLNTFRLVTPILIKMPKGIHLHKKIELRTNLPHGK